MGPIALLWRRYRVSAVLLTLGLACLLVAAAMLRGNSGSSAYVGKPPRMQPAVEPGAGVNTDLLYMSPEAMNQALSWTKAAGFTWVRQIFPWAEIERAPGVYDWTASDAAIKAVSAHGLQLVAVLGTTPSWARLPGQEQYPWSPPADYASFGRFCAAFAHRYGAQVDYYQVWDQPNIQPFWGNQYVDASAYARLLREAAANLRSNDSVAWVLTAGLAPNVENGPLNVNEMEYLRQIVRAGAADAFDILAAKPYGFDQDPSPLPSAEGLSFGRLAALHKVLEDLGLGTKPIWAVEFGWNALPPDWHGRRSPWGVAPATVQGTRGAEAMRVARDNWPWCGPMLWARLTPPDDPDDPGYGFALLGRDLQPTPLGAELVARMRSLPLGGIGFRLPDSSAATYYGGWRVTTSGADPAGPGDSVEIHFTGTALDLMVRPGPYWAVWYVTVDGQPSRALPQDQGRSYLVLYDPLGQARSTTVARGLTFGEHTLKLEVQGGWGQWPLAGWLGYRESSSNRWLGVAAVLAGATLVGLSLAIGASGWLPRRVFALADELREALPGWLGLASVSLLSLGFWKAASSSLSLLLLAGLLACVVIWPAWGAAAILAWLPLFLLPKRLLGTGFSMSEMLTWLVAGSLVIRWLFGSSKGQAIIRLRPLDLTVVSLVLVGAISSSVAANRGVAFHEWRTVILSAAGVYLTLRLLPEEPSRRMVLFGVVAGASVVALAGLVQYVSGNNLIEAGGVARIRSVYGSPNNLALYLERVIPVSFCLVYASERRSAKGLYLLCSLLLLVCGLLTRSRGLLLLGLPVAFLYLLYATRAGRARRYLLVGAMIALAAVAAVALSTGGERLASLASGQDEAAVMRLPLWRSSWAMIRDHWLLGVGPDNFLYQYRTRYILPEAWKEPNLSHPHNFALDFWSRLGVGGLIALAGMIVFGARAARRARGSSVAGVRPLASGISAALLAALAHGLVDNSFFLVDLASLTLAYLALLATMGEGPIVMELVFGRPWLALDVGPGA